MITDLDEFRNRNQLLMLDKDTPIRDAVKQMALRNIGSVIVTEAGKLAGIFTERDLLKVVADDTLELGTATLSHVMTANVKTVRGDEDPLECLEIMRNGNFRHLPIVNENNEVVGMLSQRDFIAYNWSDIFHRAESVTKASFMSAHQLWILGAGVIIYTIFLISAF